MTEEVAKGSGMKLGGWGWARANSDCPNVLDCGLRDPYGVEGLSSLRNGWDWVGLTFGRSLCHLGVQGAHIKVICCVWRVLLCGNARVASRSRDSFGFRNEGVVSGGGGFGGGNGGVGACSGLLGGCTIGGEVGSGSGEVGSPM